MKRVAFAFWTAVTAVVLAISLAPVCRAQSGGEYARVTDVPREQIDTWLKEQVKKSGGDWDNGRYSFYIGFSTGHYGSDPVSGIAMRRLAFGMMNSSLAAGDKVTPVQFEMRSTVGDSVLLTADTASRKQFVNEVPNSTMPSSHGGHDIEQALYDTLTKLPTAELHSTIILLLNKDNASQGPDGQAANLFGANNEHLMKAIRDKDFREPVERTVFHLKSESGDKQVAITALFPKKLESLPGTFGSRYPTFARETWQPAEDAPAAGEKLPNEGALKEAAKSPAAAPVENVTGHQSDGGKGVPVWVWLLLALLVIGVIAFLVVGKRTGVQGAVHEPVSATAVKVETIPGVLRVVIGPNETSLTPLTRAGTWAVGRDSGGKVVLADTTPAPTPPTATSAQAAPVTVTTVFAKLGFGPDKFLRVEADPGAQFTEIQGTAADKADSRLMVVEPGKRVVCRILPTDTAEKTRFEIVYEAQKGSKS